MSPGRGDEEGAVPPETMTLTSSVNSLVLTFGVAPAFAAGGDMVDSPRDALGTITGDDDGTLVTITGDTGLLVAIDGDAGALGIKFGDCAPDMADMAVLKDGLLDPTGDVLVTITGDEGAGATR
mmetsp:Transcript_133244/g.256486  ORF Transcript_133244/g.256486 Transcript_133244/m.256486 type:complete len:124 (-) Transcript_133244:813-1184(-)